MSTLLALLLGMGPGAAASWPPPSAPGAGDGACRFELIVSLGADDGAWSVYRDGAASPMATRASRAEAEDVALEIALDLGRARVTSCRLGPDGLEVETDAAYGCALSQAAPPACEPDNVEPPEIVHDEAADAPGVQPADD